MSNISPQGNYFTLYTPHYKRPKSWAIGLGTVASASLVFATLQYAGDKPACPYVAGAKVAGTDPSCKKPAP
jgi:hypothetical protein